MERSSQEQARGSRQITEAIESINSMVNELNQAQREYSAGSATALSLLEELRKLCTTQLDAVSGARQAQGTLVKH